MKRCGALTARAAVIPSWNTSEKSGRSWLLVPFTVILIQFGGAVIGGTFKKYGAEENFSRSVCILCFDVSPAVRLGLYGVQLDQHRLTHRRGRNSIRRFNR